MALVILHYQEIALKGRNRPWFVSQLLRNLRQATSDLGVKRVDSIMGRIRMDVLDTVDREQLSERLRSMFGIANFSFADRAPLDMAAIAEAVINRLAQVEATSFRVRVRRADKRFPLTSPEIERTLGGWIKQARGWRVDLENPDVSVRVEITSDGAYFFLTREMGAGGLPSGVSGKVACLLSGGIDSPVAAYRLMRRGCRVRFIHFHSYPIVSRTSQEKVEELVRLLTRYQLQSRLVMVAFGETQRRIVAGAPENLRVVLYRRFMMRIAGELARRHEARALITGEVVGQVASQTLENLAVIDQAANLLVLRPLIGMDKDEITAEAKRLGTYPISIIPDEDCCQLFTPRHPATAAKVAQVLDAEAALPVQDLVQSAVEGACVKDFGFPADTRAYQAQRG